MVSPKSPQQCHSAFLLKRRLLRAILVSMTRKADIHSSSTPTSPGIMPRWALQDAKARFSELVRRVRSEGPQHVTMHGRDEVVVIATEEFQRLQGAATGQVLIDALQAAPHCDDLNLVPMRAPMPVRDVPL